MENDVIDAEEITAEVAKAEAVAFERNETNKNSFGGTERMMEQLYRDLPAEVLKEYQIVPSRVRELKADKLRVLYCHDLAKDPEARAAIELNGAWTRFHKVVFVSYWQRQQYLTEYQGLLPSATHVIRNSIEPIEAHKKPNDGQINLIYHTTPHRGLDILVTAFKQLRERHPNIHLDVYSSFEIYGWNDRDNLDPLAKYSIDLAKSTEGVTYHGFKPNEEVREALKKAHIFAYPSTWVETSCIALIEAMSAGCICVHPDLGALPETAGNLTTMYDWHEDRDAHTMRFMATLEVMIEEAKERLTAGTFEIHQIPAAEYIRRYHNWNNQKNHWLAFLKSFENENREIRTSYRVFQYRA